IDTMLEGEDMSAKVFLRRAGIICAAISICVAGLTASGSPQASAAGNGRSPQTTATAGDLRSRVTGTRVLGTSGWRSVTNLSAAPAGLPSKSKQIKVLKAVLSFMTSNYA